MPGTSEFSEPLEPLPDQPAPLVRARPIKLDACPGGVKAKMRKGIRAGLEVDATYALGYRPDSNGKKFSLKHSIVVRFRDPSTGEVLAGAHWLRSVPLEIEEGPSYSRAHWILRVIAAYPKWGADWVMFRDRLGTYKMADLDVWLADREAE